VVAPGVRRLVAPNPGPMTDEGTNTYLIGDRAVAVVDPGPADVDHVAAIIAALPPASHVAAILITHGHADHVGALAMLQARTSAPVYGHPDVRGVDRALGDGDRIEIDAVAIDALTTPGHADDHLCFWLPDRRALFSGDLVVGRGTVVLSQTVGALGHYLASLERLLALDSFLLLPGHGPPAPDGAAKVAEYLAHRRARESQIVAALSNGAATVDELVGRLYAATPTGLHHMAARNVLAHLERLADLGRAEQLGGSWHRKT
jgi:glyoxylase-like metal-dependent hydrolase (beta-lactamase superfamily II)